MTLRRHVLAYLALATVASCVLTVAVGAVLVRRQISAQRMTALVNQADVLAAVGGAPDALGAGEHVYAVQTGRARRLGPARTADVLAAIPPARSAQGRIDVHGHELLFVARLTRQGRLVLVRRAALAFAEWRPFLGSLALAGLGGVLLAALLSVLLARRVTRPLGDLAAATARLASGERGVAVPIEGDQEIAALGTAFNRMSGELDHAYATQRSFLESVSHELKTPLTSIRGYAEALCDGAVPSEAGGRVIAAEADRLERLVQDLLELGRLGRAGFAVTHEPVDLHGAAERAVERFSVRARELGVELSSSRTADRAWAIGDEGRLMQATANLIENALRVTPAGGTVTVRAEPATLTVGDTGPGLSPEEIPHAFDRFYLYERHRTELTVGSGLGLAIVRELILAMNGTVTAGNGPGGGAEFTVRLPPCPPPRSGPQPNVQTDVNVGVGAGSPVSPPSS